MAFLNCGFLEQALKVEEILAATNQQQIIFITFIQEGRKALYLRILICEVEAIFNFHFDLGLLTPCTMNTTSDISGLRSLYVSKSVDVSTISFLNIFSLQSNIQVWGLQKKYYLKVHNLKNPTINIEIIYVLFVNHIFANGHKEILKILIRFIDLDFKWRTSNVAAIRELKFWEALLIDIIYVLFLNHIFANGHKEILKILIHVSILLINFFIDLWLQEYS
ncbi:hypothetical protein ACJX0J_024973, partial [Zea mays]